MICTPENITYLDPNQIFVFGSNLAGVHGAGAAKTAFKKFGAVWSEGRGLWGCSYAIPTKNMCLKTLPLEHIGDYVSLFLEDAAALRHLTFLVTPIGCGLSGYTPKDIAPLFLKGPRSPTSNIIFPRSFFRAMRGS